MKSLVSGPFRQTFLQVLCLALATVIVGGIPNQSIAEEQYKTCVHHDKKQCEACVQHGKETCEACAHRGKKKRSKIKWAAEYRPRLEFSNRTLTGLDEDWFTTHRARLTLDAPIGDWSLRLAPQHVLTWGTEASTLAQSSGSLDFHEAWVRYSGSSEWTIGRQEIAFDDHRLIGTVNWTQQGRAFDAIRYVRLFEGSGTLQVLSALLTEAGAAGDTMLVAAHFKISSFPLSLVSINEIDLDTHSHRETAGLHYQDHFDQIALSGSVYGQFGVQDDGATEQDLQAWMAAVSISHKSALGKFSLGVDVLSGDDTVDDVNSSFDTLYATNHKFYGAMDYFLNIPVHTGGLGLLDAMLKYRKKVDDVTLGVDVHWFGTQLATAASNSDLGIEVDLSAKVPLTKKVNFVAGLSAFVAGEAMVDIGRADESGTVGTWAFVQLQAKFGGK